MSNDVVHKYLDICRSQPASLLRLSPSTKRKYYHPEARSSGGKLNYYIVCCINMNEAQAEAKLFIFELANLAKEHWFKPGENWAISLTNEAEKAKLLKQYYPILYITGDTKTLTGIAVIICSELLIAVSEPMVANEHSAAKQPATYLVAYNPDRERK